MQAHYAANTRTLQLVREYPQHADRVWAALTTPLRLAEWMNVDWLSDPEMTLSLGARFDYRFRDSGLESYGVVLRWEPPHCFEHSWFENLPPPSRVCWEVEPTAAGCRLRLTHRFPTDDDAPRTAAGWTLLLNRLDGALGGASPALSWRELRDSYRQSLGPAAARDGRLTEVDGIRALRFERRIARPLPAVWEALSTPQGIARWLQADASMELRVGGRMLLRFHGGDHSMDGRIIACTPPQLLEYSWCEANAGADSRVRFELQADGDSACRLQLTHFLPDGKDLADFASGWHWHLDGVEAAAAGRSVAFDRQRWQVLQRVYQMTL